MADKPLEIHPAALAEFKSALAWYMKRSETAAVKFAAQVDRGMDLIVEAPGRLAQG
jgi:plasmid stabilization system protein ParE